MDAVPWLEILADNYFDLGSPRYKKLEKLAPLYSLVFHCVGFNLGSSDPLDRDYLKRVKDLVDTFRPAWVSDHLCFCGHGGEYSPDLLPIPYTDALLDHIRGKIGDITNCLGVPFLVENVSAYMKFKDSSYTEEEFLNRLAQLTGCGILLDVNNLYVNSRNYDFDPYEAFLNLPMDHIKQMHLAGHVDYGTHVIDTHSTDIQGPVLALFQRIVKKLGPIPVAIERDENIPPFKSMFEEMERVRTMCYG